jgi:hydrogenase large subunit
MIQNIIQGCDLVMSHITHLYHLSALDFINTSSFPAMGPWMPSYTASDMLPAGNGTALGNIGSTLVVHYVQALEKRRKMHTAGALFSGRQPIQNAMVPGGVTTLFSSTMPGTPLSGTHYDTAGPFNAAETKSRFATLINDVRNFIDTVYIPDVLTVAGAFGTTHPVNFFTQGIGCRRFLAYGDYPDNNTGKLAVKRGIVDIGASGTTVLAFDQLNIKEYVGGSYYNYGVLDLPGKHPFDGVTTPNMGTGGYSWIKAPRYNNQPCEVGPLARMVVTYACGTAAGVPVPTLNTVLGLSGTYTAAQLVGAAVTSALGGNVNLLFSALGRHAARALEAKYVADACAAWAAALTADASCYFYKKIPKQVSTGYGLTEAPRGALGHWIKIEGKKTAKYQCVVPSTWNFSPDSGTGDAGPVEMALENSFIGTNSTDQIVNILRLVHPFDCCIACAVHVVTPEGKEKLRFAIGPDGKPSNVEIAE